MFMYAVAYLGFYFGGVQNIFVKVGVFAWREAPCSAWRSTHLLRGFGGMLTREFFLNSAIWCVLENIWLKFGNKKL